MSQNETITKQKHQFNRLQKCCNLLYFTACSFGPVSSEFSLTLHFSPCHCFFVCPWKELRHTAQLQAPDNFSSFLLVRGKFCHSSPHNKHDIN